MKLYRIVYKDTAPVTVTARTGKHAVKKAEWYSKSPILDIQMIMGKKTRRAAFI